ncbi:hypothetical protein FHX14_005251 [Rhizobium sp. BK619]|nr:hypothetical protein [Rhizobium sp. BK619]
MLLKYLSLLHLQNIRRWKFHRPPGASPREGWSATLTTAVEGNKQTLFIFYHIYRICTLISAFDFFHR